MATKSKAAAKAKAKSTKGGTSKAATRKATRKATETSEVTPEQRKAEREALRAEQTERMLEMREEGSSWQEIADELDITPGKAQFLNMLHRVATGDVKPYPKSKVADEESLAEIIKDARDEAGEFSSWGWIAARSGLSEPTLKRIHEEHNKWKPKTENIAIERAKKHGDTGTAKAKSKSNGSSAKGKGGKTTATKAAKAKAKAKARGRAADPS